ncbi:hypothetical protein LG315_10140 [Microbacterium marinum]|uniref:hypothetical protein n=1 Tax=Microbacterium marinum TaxID=421115 RepID=UPI00384ABEF5
MRGEPRSRPFVALLLAALTLTGCAAAPSDPVPSPTTIDLDGWTAESGNGLTLLSGAAAREVVLSRVDAADAVAMSATFRGADGGELRSKTRRAGSDRAATVVAGARTVRIVMIGDRGYLREGDGAYRCVARGDAALDRWMPLSDADELLATLTADASGLGSPREDGTVDLLLGTEQTTGTLVVTSQGDALPQRLVRADAAGTFEATFSGWTDDSPIEVPSPLGDGC